MKTLLTSNKFTLKKKTQFPFVEEYSSYILWFQLMKLFMIVPVNYPANDLFVGKNGMLTKVNKGIFITIVFQLVYHSFTNGQTP